MSSRESVMPLPLSGYPSGSRLLFAMGRDGVPPKSFFGTLHERFGAFLAFSLVNLSMIFHYWIGGEKKVPRELVLLLVFPFIGLVADFTVTCPFLFQA